MGRDLEIESGGPPFTVAEGKLTYGSYLQVDRLLSLQKLESTPPAQDEILFIITHQTYELWFKQLLHDLDIAVDQLLSGELVLAFRLFERSLGIFDTLVSQIAILETMTPVSFNRFRDKLNPASGFQSLQFRELEALLGSPHERTLKLTSHQPAWADAVAKRLSKPSLRDAFIATLQSEHFFSEPTYEAIEKAVVEIYHDPQKHMLHSLCEFLISLDERLGLWRFRHVQMVERMIGGMKGTGGSLGAPYLKSTLETKFFAELWTARNQMRSNSTYG